MKPIFLLSLLSLAGCEVQFSDPNACRCAKPHAAPLRLEVSDYPAATTNVVGDVFKVPGDSPWATEFELGFELGTLGASAEQAKAMIKQFRAGRTHDIKFWIQTKTGHYPK